MDINDASHKVLVVLDHGPRFSRNSHSKVTMTLKNGPTTDLRDVAEVEKSMWTWSVEAAVELHRIISDVFPDNDKLLRFVMADCVGRQLQSNWGGDLIAYDELCSSLITAGPASTGDIDEVTIRSGITLAIEALSELTGRQQQMKRSLEMEKTKKRKREVAGEDGELSGSDKSEDEDEQMSDEEEDGQDMQVGRVEEDDEEAETEEGKEGRKTETGSAGKTRQADDSDDDSNEFSIRKLIAKPVSKSLVNTGAIVIFSSFFSDNEIKELEEFVSETIENRNRNISRLNADSLAEISKVKLFIMNTFPSNSKSCITTKELTQISPSLFSSVMSAACGELLIRTTHTLTIRLYDLVSTTVSGIPMKEEAQPAQSVNYDVELLHPRDVHAMLESLGLLSDKFLLSKVSDLPDSSYSTVRLSWATPSPKNKWNLFPRVFLSVPLTTTSVTSRPSACLTSFLLSGRNVMLEVKPKENMPALEPNVGQKLISHTLIAHEGRIHIHSIYLGKINTFDNKTLRNKYLIPVDKRVRAHEFRVLMKECALFLNSDNESEQANGKEMKVVKSRGVNELEQEPCEAATSQINNLLRYWPIHKDSTLIRFEGSKYESMFNLLRQAELSTADVDKCKQGISQISALRDSRDFLYPPDISCTKLKQPSTREDQYSVLIREIRDHMLNYVEHSDRHFEVFNLFVQVMGLERNTNIVLNDPQASSKPNMDAKIGKKFAHTNKKADPRLARERRGSPPLKRTAKDNDWKPGERINLYSMLCEQENEKGRDKWREFAGRVNATSSQAILYPNLNADQSAHNSHSAHASHSNEQRPSSRMET